MMKHLLYAALAVGLLIGAPWASSSAPSGNAPLKSELRSLPFRIAWECYVNGNWEIFVMHADGSHAVNLTKTPKNHEHYPQVSPDGRKIAFSIDKGSGRDTVRSLWVMDVDGTHRKKIADYAREPFWCPDSHTIGYLPQQYPKFNVEEAFNKGMVFYDIRTGKLRPHPYSDSIWRIYNPSFARNGKWIAVAVDGGMGWGHAIILIEAHGSRMVDLRLRGCRPALSPDGQHIAWGATDHDLCIAPLDLTADFPVADKPTLTIHDAVNKIYHIHWSPDSRYVAFSRGPDGEGDLTKQVSFRAANEIVGVYAAGWNLYAASAQRTGVIDFKTATDADIAQLTFNGASNKQPEWFRASRN
jgi:Tol biopolymer transport system component